MKRKTLVVLGVPVVLLFAAACEQQDTPEMADAPPAAEASDKAVAEVASAIRADIAGVGEAGSAVRGNVEVVSGEASAESYFLAVTLQGVPPGEHAWHIHRGPCDAQNAPVAVPLSQAGDEEALTGALVAAADSSVNGTVAIPSAELTMEQLRGGDYSLRIHSRAGRDHGPTIACADL